MEMHFTMFTLLVLTLQAFSGVRPQDSEETQSIQPLLPNTENATGFNSLPHASGGGDPSEISWSINGMGNDAMITEPPPVNVPRKDSTLAPPAVKPNGNESIPALPGKVNGTVNGVNASSINNPDAGSNHTSKPEIRNTTQPSPLKPPKTTSASSVNNKTTSKPAIVVPVQPITQPIPPKLNSTTTKPNATTTATKLNSTTTSTKPNSTTTASNLTAASSGTTLPEAAVSGNNSHRGETERKDGNRNGKAWGAIIGIALAVGFVGFVIYLLLKKTNRREFMHRKLVEDMPSDPEGCVIGNGENVYGSRTPLDPTSIPHPSSLVRRTGVDSPLTRTTGVAKRLAHSLSGSPFTLLTHTATQRQPPAGDFSPALMTDPDFQEANTSWEQCGVKGLAQRPNSNEVLAVILRLDNGEPLDLKFDGTAYYNPGLQGDNIQMTNFPRGRVH
ncbi:hypothetical protein JZ751_021098 [Albula glossodonta]|uniref:Uncharacterized protein n=1 Tax=Albula glossodonta TaxID=121402 RepID=A0A8T2PJF0_9TELE|nr:hypothetical protein JZ751_021098 [Albula glossodonta]